MTKQRLNYFAYFPHLHSDELFPGRKLLGTNSNRHSFGPEIPRAGLLLGALEIEIVIVRKGWSDFLTLGFQNFCFGKMRV